jgi:cellulose synthase/poly-beta-1,6-N-acetylglucosamine synthase-like glycosyltransferase
VSTFTGEGVFLERRRKEFQDYLERREKVVKEIDGIRCKLLELDQGYYRGDLSKVAYLRERNLLLRNPHETMIGFDPEKYLDFRSLALLDERYFKDQLSTFDYHEKTGNLIEAYLGNLKRISIQRERRDYERILGESAKLEKEVIEDDEVQLSLFFDYFEDEPEAEEPPPEPPAPEYNWTQDPDRVVLVQRLLFLATLLVGNYLIISPNLNYYSKLNTAIYFIVIVGGIYSYHFYKHPAKGGFEPYVSIIIPIYNNGEQIYQVIRSHLKSDYPKDKLELIIANDGSTDGTTNEIRRAIMDFPHTYIKHLYYPQNQGKRKIIQAAFHESTGRILVRADSDTTLEEDSIRRIVEPLQDPETKGVTGRVYVQNHTGNLWTRIQKVRYNYAFQQLYSFQNLLGSILCLPGCFSAYSRDALELLIDCWAETKPTLSEDRQMTHLLLENGYKTVFVKQAICHTKVPNSFKGYTSQQLRWGKANLLQQLRATRFMYKKNSKIFLFYLITYLISLTTPYAIVRILLITPNWGRWLTIVTLASLGRGLVTEGASLNVLFAVPLFYFHFLLDLIKMPLAMLTLNKED